MEYWGPDPIIPVLHHPLHLLPYAAKSGDDSEETDRPQAHHGWGEGTTPGSCSLRPSCSLRRRRARSFDLASSITSKSRNPSAFSMNIENSNGFA